MCFVFFFLACCFLCFIIPSHSLLMVHVEFLGVDQVLPLVIRFGESTPIKNKSAQSKKYT